MIFETIHSQQYINVTMKSLYLYVPTLTPNTQTQVLFNESLMNNYRITFDSWYTESEISNDGKEVQTHIGSAQNINSPKYLITVFQTNDRVRNPDKTCNPAVFDTNHGTK